MISFQMVSQPATVRIDSARIETWYFGAGQTYEKKNGGHYQHVWSVWSGLHSPLPMMRSSLRTTNSLGSATG